MPTYWVQRQAPAGNWVDDMGFGERREAALRQLDWIATYTRTGHRVIERVDTMIEELTPAGDIYRRGER